LVSIVLTNILEHAIVADKTYIISTSFRMEE